MQRAGHQKQSEQFGRGSCAPTRSATRPYEANAQDRGYSMSGRARGWVTTAGYRLMSIGKRRAQYEHILAWEAATGSIPNGMVLHHLNGNRLDTRLVNLSLMTRQEHGRIHSPCYKRKAGRWTKRCPVCGRFRSLENYYPLERSSGLSTVAGACKPCEVQRVCENRRKRANRRLSNAQNT